MQTTINVIKSALANATTAIHEAVRAYGDDPEFTVLHARLQEAATCLLEAEKQAARIKARIDAENDAQAGLNAARSY